MTKQDIINLRLKNLQIVHPKFTKPEELVSYLGAVQSQDFAGANWAMGIRIPGSTWEDIEKAFNEGKILRTHCLRPTWHFVAPEDIRWMMELNAPQVKRILGSYNKKLDLDENIFKKTNQIIERFVRGKNVTREQLKEALKEHGITGDNQRMGHIVGWAELDNIICSGPRIGKQFSYSLMEERVPKTKNITREEALAKLIKIFYQTRGPATIKDFCKWSGINQAEVQKTVELVTPKLLEETIDGKVYYFNQSTPPLMQISPTVYLLPNYDEYVSGFADYSILADLEKVKNINTARNPVFWNHLVIDGKIEGSWRRIMKKDKMEIELDPIRDLSKAEMESVEKATLDFGKFWGMKVEII